MQLVRSNVFGAFRPGSRPGLEAWMCASLKQLEHAAADLLSWRIQDRVSFGDRNGYEQVMQMSVP